MTWFTYAEGISRQLKSLVLRDDLETDFAAVLQGVCAQWDDGISVTPCAAQRIHRAMPRLFSLTAAEADLPALFITPMEAREKTGRPLGKAIWSGSYEFYLTYCDTATEDEVLQTRLSRYVQALAEFIRHQPTLDGFVQFAAVRGFIYNALYFPADSGAADMSIVLEIQRQEG